MTISFLSGSRIQGLSTDTVETLTFEDDFSTDKGWTTSDSSYMGYDSGNSRLKTNWYGSSGNRTVVYDLGAGNVSNSAWILRMKINFGTSSGADNEGFIGISDSNSAEGRASSQKFVGVSFLAMYTVSSSANGFYECEADDVILPPTNNTLLQYNFSASTDYWLEIKRTSSTGLTYTLYSDSTFNSSALLGSESTTIAEITGLQFIKFANYPTASTNLSNAYVDDVEFWDGVTSLTSKPTDVPNYTRFEETDTRKIFTKLPYFTATTGLKAYYKFDTSSGNMDNKASEVGSSVEIANSEMVNTGVTYSVTGLINNALSYDGTNDQSSASNSLASDWKFLNVSGAAMTIITWMKADAFSSTETLLCTTNFGGGLAGVLIELETNRSMRFHLGKNGTDKIDFTTGSAIFPNDTASFHMVMMRYNDATGVLSVSVDDGTQQTDTGNNLTNTNDPSGVLFIGQDSTGAEYMGADMDECSIWDRYLSDDEITSLYNSGNGKAILSNAWKEKGQN